MNFLIRTNHNIYNTEKASNDNNIKLLDKSHTCVELLLDLKDGNITNLRLNDNQKMSLLIQMIYAIYLMRKSKYQHRDIHPANICYKEGNIILHRIENVTDNLANALSALSPSGTTKLGSLTLVSGV